MSKGLFVYKKNCSNKIPKPVNLEDKDIKILKKIKDNIPKLVEMINKQNLNEYTKTVVNLSFEANKYFNDAEPWVFKEKIQIE